MASKTKSGVAEWMESVKNNTLAGLFGFAVGCAMGGTGGLVDAASSPGGGASHLKVREILLSVTCGSLTIPCFQTDWELRVMT